MTCVSELLNIAYPVLQGAMGVILLFLLSAGGRNRTDMPLRAEDFESSASTSFTTPACVWIYMQLSGYCQLNYSRHHHYCQDIYCEWS